MRKQISVMSAVECSDELAFDRIKKLISKARKADEMVEKCTQDVFDLLGSMCIDIDRETDAENATSLEEAISCFIHYGEYGLKNLMKEIREAYAENM